LGRELTTIEAAKLSGYTADHITLLLRRKVLIGQKKGRDWFVEEDSLKKYVAAGPKPGRKTS
jgi:hypothetical protein